MPPRRQPSSIDRLPPEIRDSIADLRRKGHTIDEIMAHLERLQADVSRSAVGRYVKSMAEIGEEMRRSDAMSRFIIEEFGDEADERVGRANMRILQGALMQLITERPVDDDGAPVSLSADEAKSISLSLQRLISAQRMDADRQMKIRAQAKKEAAEEAMATVNEVAATVEGGLTAETVELFRLKLLGIKPK